MQSGESGDEVISQGSRGSRVSKSEFKKVETKVGILDERLERLRSDVNSRFAEMKEENDRNCQMLLKAIQGNVGSAGGLVNSAAERFQATTEEQGARSDESNIRSEDEDNKSAADDLYVADEHMDGDYKPPRKSRERNRRRESNVFTINGGPPRESYAITHVLNKKEFELVLKSIDLKAYVFHMAQLRKWEADGRSHIDLAVTIDEKAKSVLLSMWRDIKKQYQDIVVSSKNIRRATELKDWLREVVHINEIDNFYGEPRQRLDEIIRLCIRPRTAFGFLENCKKCWKFRAPDNFIPGPMNWSVTLSCFLEYSTLVRRTFETQAFSGSDRFYDGTVIPKLDSGRPNDTLAGVFLANLPTDLANFIALKVWKGKHKEFGPYLEEVNETVHGINKNVSLHVKPFFSIWASSQERQAQGKLMNISQAMMYSLDGEEEFANGDPPVTSQEQFDAAVDAKVEKKLMEELAELNAIGLPTMATSKFGASRDFDPKKLPCSLKAQYGECKKEGCKFSHDEAMCRMKAKEMQKAWSKSPYLAIMEHGEDEA